MKRIQQQQDALNILFDMKEKVFIQKISDLNLIQKNYILKLNILKHKLNNIPTLNINDYINNISLLQNNSDFEKQLILSEKKLLEDLTNLNNNLKLQQQDFTQLLLKRKSINNYFNELKKRKQFIIDKKEEARIQDQYNSLKKNFGFSDDDLNF